MVRQPLFSCEFGLGSVGIGELTVFSVNKGSPIQNLNGNFGKFTSTGWLVQLLITLFLLQYTLVEEGQIGFSYYSQISCDNHHWIREDRIWRVTHTHN